jgi:hypothetical protein
MVKPPRSVNFSPLPADRKNKGAIEQWGKVCGGLPDVCRGVGNGLEGKLSGGG